MALAAAPEVPGFRAPSPLGHGPTSTIYSAQSLSLARWVALTVYSITLRDEQSQRRFRRGFEVSRRLGAHPHAVTVLELGLTPDCQPFVVSELYEHGTVENQIQEGQPSSVGEVLRLGIALASVLETAHRAGVVHGGIHPARILLDENREPALGDLGLVPLVDRTGLAALVGPMTYHAPPEVLEGEPPSPATDVYSLASTLYTALAGRAPYAPPAGLDDPHGDDEDTSASLLLRILQHDIPAIERRDVPPSLEKILDQALSSEARHRPARPLALAQALHSCQVELGLATSQPLVLDIPATLNVVQGGTPDDVPPSLASAPAAPAPSIAPPTPAAAPMTAPPSPERVFIPYPVPEPEPHPEPAWHPAPEPRPEPAWHPEREPVAPPSSALMAPAEHREMMAPRFDNLPAPPAQAPVEHRATVATIEPELEVRPAPAPINEAAADAPRTRALPVIVLAILVAVIFAGVTWSIVTGEEEGERAQADESASGPDRTADPLVSSRSGLTAVESPVGVQLDWDGRSDDTQVVMVFSTAAPPQSRPADTGSALTIPTADLDPSAGYCFAVVPASSTPSMAELAAEVSDDALGTDSCIRNGSADTVRRG